MERTQLLDHARSGLQWQRESLAHLEQQLNDSFCDAAERIATASKVVTTGLGKSGFIARKMAATLTSVHIPGVYLHPVDALHGDLGMLRPTDVLIAFSKSGETAEIVHLTKLVLELGMPVISISSRQTTTMGSIATIELVAPCVHEYDQHNILPTTSTTQALILADLLSVAAAHQTGDLVERLQRSHPQGGIGSALLRTVEQVMHGGDALPRVGTSASVSDAVEVLSQTALGIVCVMDDAGALEGILTDGDVRRLVATSEGLMAMPVRAVMTSKPVVVSAADTLHAALQLMERRDRQIGAVPVMLGERCVGVVRVHDIVRAQW